MIFLSAIELYIKNLKASLAFGILLLFVFFFSLLPNLFIGSGSIFLDYSLKGVGLVELAAELALIAVFLMFYSVFLTLIIFSVRKELSAVKIDYYIREMLQRFAWKIFFFYLIFSIALGCIAFIGINLGVLLHPFAFIGIGAVILLIALAFLFVPQAIVIDESNLQQSIQNNFEFIRRHFSQFVFIVIVSSILLGLTPLIEIYFDLFAFSGRFVSLIITLIVFIPFIEIMKSEAYMHKFELVKSVHKMKEAQKKKKKK